MTSLWGQTLSKRELLRRVGRLDQVGGVRLATLGDGRERGVRVLEVRTGRLSFDVLVDRAMDVWRCDLGGMPVAWISPNGAPGPWYGEQMSESGWLRTFPGGLFSTCGLDHTGGGGIDDIDHVFAAELPTERFGLHGRVGTIPARLTGYGEQWEGDECILWAEGEIAQTAFYGEKLILRRRIEADLGGTTIRVHDRVENVGFTPVTHMFLYHVNVGWPIVDDGAELLIPATNVRAVDGINPGDYRRIGPPEGVAPERVFEHEVAANPDGTVSVAVVNRRRGLGFIERFRLDQLPRQNTWRMLADGFYALGLEPATNRDSGRWEARRHGELQVLEPEETRDYEVSFAILEGADELDRAAALIAAAMAGADQGD